MAVIQTSKVQMRRGPELELPGVPTSLIPLRFEPGLDVGELGYAVDTGRLFIGHLPNAGQINYKRSQFPYQNVEVLTEASIDTIRRIFGFLDRDKGAEAYYTALISPGDDWQDVYVERTSGAAVPYRFPGDDVIATIEYYATAWYTEDNRVHRDPIRQGTLRILSQDSAEEAHVADEAASIRRRDLTTARAVEGDWAHATIGFRVLRAGNVGDRYHRFQVRSDLDHDVRLYFSAGRPTRTKASPFEAPLVSPTTVAGPFTRDDIEDIVGAMVSNNVEDRISVDYNRSGRKLNFNVEDKRGFPPFVLNIRGEVIGTHELDGFDQSIEVALSNTGVTPGTYTYSTVKVDAKGRIQDISNGAKPNVYTASNLGTGAGVYAKKVADEFQFRSIKAGTNVTIDLTDTEVVVNAAIPPTLTVSSPDGSVSAVSEITVDGGVVMTDMGNGKVSLLVQTGGGLGVSGDYVRLVGKETVEGEKTFNANTRVTNGTFSVETPDDYPFCGLEVPMRQPVGASAYLYWNPSENSFTAYTGYGNKNLALAPITASSFKGNATSADRWSTPRVVTLTGDVSGTGIIDGSGDATIFVTSQATGSAVDVWEETVPLVRGASTIDFTGTGVTVSGSGKVATVSVPGPRAFAATGVASPQAFTGELLDENHTSPTLWKPVATLKLTPTPAERLQINASALIGENARGFDTQRFMRLSIDGNVVATVSQPWGDANSGGALSISYLDATSHIHEVAIVVEVAYMANNNGAPGFMNTFKVHNAAINAFAFTGEVSYYAQ